MRVDEAFELLMKCAAYDQRTIGESDSMAWAEALADVLLVEAIEVVPVFYRSPVSQQRRMSPADVLHLLQASRREAAHRAHVEHLREEREAAEQVRAAKGGGHFRAVYAEAAATAREECRGRRALVLSYSDLAQRLCEPPIGYKAPDQWNGYIPPGLDAKPAVGPARRNESLRRAALIELYAEAWERHEKTSGGVSSP